MKTIALPLLIGTLLLVAGHASAAEQPKTLAIGAAAPDFTLPGVDGKQYALKDFDSSPILAVIFTCNHCPTAQAYEERIMKLVDEYKPKGVAFVAINPNDPKSVRLDELAYSDLGDSFADMKIRAAQKKFNFPYLYDGDTEAVSRLYGPATTPHVFVFDKERKLRYVGRIDDSERPAKVKKQELRDALEALIAGKEPPVTQTHVFGCSVKWASKEESIKTYNEKLDAEPVTIEKADLEAIKKIRKNDDSKGKVRLINLWATWCAPCVAEFPELVAINRTFRGRNFELVTISMNAPDEDMDALEFLKKKQASMRNVIYTGEERDPLNDAIDKDWSGALPYTALIAPGGEVLYKHQGAIDPLELKRQIVKVLKEDRP